MVCFGRYRKREAGAGLAAYASWGATLQLLTARGGPPCVFTDYCEEAALRGAQVIAALAPSEAADSVAISPGQAHPRKGGQMLLPGGVRGAEVAELEAWPSHLGALTPAESRGAQCLFLYCFGPL